MWGGGRSGGAGAMATRTRYRAVDAGHVPPVVIARFLLSLPYSRHRRLATLVVRRHGPVVVIGGAGYIGSQTVSLLLSAATRCACWTG